MTPNLPIPPDAGDRGSAIGHSFGYNMARHGWAKKFVIAPHISSFTLHQGRMAIAAVGQGATQAPQPVHRSGAISGSGLPPRRGGKRIARASQKSPQVRHSTPCFGRQAGPLTALSDHGA